jgi:hypothetical protein
LHPADNAKGVRLSLAESIDSAITTVHNWSHNLLTPEHGDAEFMMQREMGVRGRFSYGFSRNTPAGAALPLDDITRFKRNMGVPITTHSGMFPHQPGGIKALGAAGLVGRDVQSVHATNSTNPFSSSSTSRPALYGSNLANFLHIV